MKKTNEILKTYREKKGYSLRKMASELEISPGYISDIENERRSFPKTEIGDKIVELLKISSKDVTAIQEYEDYKKAPKSIKNELEKQKKIDQVRSSAHKFRKEYFKRILVDPSQAESYDILNEELADHLLKKGFKEEEINSYLSEVEEYKELFNMHNKNIQRNNENPQTKTFKKSEKKVTIERNRTLLPVYTHISIKNESLIYNGEVIDYYTFDRENNNKNKLLCLLVEDDSMEPLIPKYSDIVIEEMSEITNESIGVFFVNGELCIRRLKTYGEIKVLRSTNTNYEDIEVKKQDNFITVGKVIECKRKFK